MKKIDEIQSTGYRYVSSEAPYLDDLIQNGTIPVNPDGTYFSLDKFDDAVTASKKLQVPHDASIRVEFDTPQIADGVEIPYGKYGTSDYFEPMTRDYLEYGTGEAKQLITRKSIQAKKITNLNTGEILYEK